MLKPAVVKYLNGGDKKKEPLRGNTMRRIHPRKLTFMWPRRPIELRPPNTRSEK